MRATDRRHLDTRWLQDVGHAGLLVAVLGVVDEADKPAFSRMRHSAASTMAICVGAGPSGGRAGTTERTGTAAWLQAHGWRATEAASGAPAASVWQELGASGRTGAPRGGGTGAGVAAVGAPGAVSGAVT